GRQQLERQLLLDEHVLGQVDRAHATLAQLADETVTIRDDLAHERVGRAGHLADGHCLFTTLSRPWSATRVTTRRRARPPASRARRTERSPPARRRPAPTRAGPRTAG